MRPDTPNSLIMINHEGVDVISVRAGWQTARKQPLDAIKGP